MTIERSDRAVAQRLASDVVLATVTRGRRPMHRREAADGSVQVSPTQTTTYKLTATGSGGSRTATTARKNFATIVNHIFPFFGSLKLSEITEVTVEDFRATLQSKQYRVGRSYSPAFINDCLRQLHGILSKAARRKLIDAVPAFPRALSEPKLMLELSADEEEAFLRAFDDREASRRRNENAARSD